MIVHNELTRFTQLLFGLRRIVGLDAEREGTQRLSETLTPIIDPWGRWKPEWDLPRGEIPLWRGRTSAAGGVGTFAKQQAKVPAGVNRLMVIEGVWMSSDVAGSVAVVAHGADLTTLVGGFYNRDMRATTPTGVGQLRELVDATTPGTELGRIYLQANVLQYAPLNFVCMPGFGLMLRLLTGNQVLQVFWIVYERELLPGETLR